MRFTPLTIPGAYVIDLEPIADSRGSFARSFCANEFGAHGLRTEFPQHSRSQNLKKGTLRGMHWQEPPHAEAKVVTCVRGGVYDVCLDLRRDSPAYLKWYGVELTDENRRQLYIPEGCAHGFQALTDNAEISYLISTFWAPDAGRGARYDDPAFAIEWPLPVTEMSEKDRAWPAWRA
jgi:dTDP-4-dehydrorhamnose 3,5-epimerase